ncbi:hypothetical protein FB384_003312 [Prauserella sediminis]|uniref:Uncharacterized protein n=1 Tax=Prauserella sediminis TaxID=577680 RepID=A0A839XTQ8_9PSEU|nr:hypothetical protein [Prauserella sediminis]MBB3664408.1 hypothetical protein [Prauserella sediminis]
MGISGRADLPWTAVAVGEARLRGAEPGPYEEDGDEWRRRQEALDVEAWEARRRGRTVRLWCAELLVRTTARDVEDATFRLVTLAHPYHRTGHARRLCSVAGPVRWSPPGSVDAAVDGRLHGGPHPSSGPEYETLVGGLPCGPDVPRRDAERAQSADHAAALELAGRGVRRTLPQTSMPGPCWQVWQRVSFLAGPGDAPARAAELAATIVDTRGAPAAAVTRIEPQDGRRDPGEGRLVHPACDAGPRVIDALWDDFDAVEAGLGDPGEPVALASVCLAAAREVRAEFGLVSGRPVPAGGRVRCAVAGHAEGDAPGTDR